jgi:hypothetical protein
MRAIHAARILAFPFAVPERCSARTNTMRRLGSFLKGYTLGTLFVLVHVATHELRRPK